MSGQERKLDAAEYVIGTLSAVERSAFEVSIETDSTTREDVTFWERTFGALNASVSPQAPPADLWQRIDAALPGGADAVGDEAKMEADDPTAAAAAAATAASSSAVSRADTAAPAGATTQTGVDTVGKATTAANDNALDGLRRSVRRWRVYAVAASIAALGLGAFILNGPTNPFAPPSQQLAGNLQSGKYIAVVNANGDQPSLVINIDAATGDVTVRSVGVERPEGKSLELWYVPDGQKAVSVGLVGEGGIDLKDITAKNGDLLAISLEPSGGSPTGTATGPVIYTGKLLENVTED